MPLSQVRRLNAAVAVCRYFPVRRYRLIKVCTYDFKKFGPVPSGLNGHDSISKRYSTINDENKYKSKDHLYIYFQNDNKGK